MVEEINTGSDTQIDSRNYCSEILSVVELDNDRVFITYETSVTPKGLYGVVCTVEGATISVGTAVKLSTNNYTDDVLSTIKLSSNKVIIFYSYSSSYSMRAMICTINGTEITKETDVGISGTYTGEIISAVKLNENRIFIVHGSTSYHNLYCIVITVENTTITVGTDVKLTSKENNNNKYISAVKLNENKVFIAYDKGTSSSVRYLYGSIATIDGATISFGNPTQLSTVTNSGYVISALVLDPNRVFIFHAIETGSGSSAVVCTINETTITVGVDTQLSINYISDYVVTVELYKDRVLITYGATSNICLYGVLCKINNTTITEQSTIQLSTLKNSGKYISIALLTEGKIFIAHSYNTTSELYGMLFTLNEYIQLLTTPTDDIYGVAKTNGTEGNMVDIYRPLPEEVAV